MTYISITPPNSYTIQYWSLLSKSLGTFSTNTYVTTTKQAIWDTQERAHGTRADYYPILFFLTFYTSRGCKFMKEDEKIMKLLYRHLYSHMYVHLHLHIYNRAVESSKNNTTPTPTPTSRLIPTSILSSNFDSDSYSIIL